MILSWWIFEIFGCYLLIFIIYITFITLIYYTVIIKTYIWYIVWMYTMYNIRLVLALYENKGSKLKYITINYKWFLVGVFLIYLLIFILYILPCLYLKIYSE